MYPKGSLLPLWQYPRCHPTANVLAKILVTLATISCEMGGGGRGAGEWSGPPKPPSGVPRPALPWPRPESRSKNSVPLNTSFCTNSTASLFHTSYEGLNGKASTGFGWTMEYWAAAVMYVFCCSLGLSELGSRFRGAETSGSAKGCSTGGTGGLLFCDLSFWAL